MYYYNIAPASTKFFGKECLTYSYEEELATGRIVVVELNEKKSFGIIFSKTNKPKFKTKSIISKTEYSLEPTAMNFIQEFIAYYPNFLGPVVNLFVPANFPKNISKKSKEMPKPKPVELSKTQRNVINAIEKEDSRTTILHGVTGSGKTRIYVELARKMLIEGKSSIILVPEISLTTKIVADFEKTFGKDNLAVYHSKLSTNNRNKLWVSVYKNPKIIIGPRSALFLPAYNLGLIVSDEFHDESYVQDTQPSYNAIKAASILSKSVGAKLLLGSATPNVTDYHQVKSKDSHIIDIDEKAIKSKHKIAVEIIDMKNQENITNGSNLLSKELIKQIKIALSNKKQSLIFINRRGTSRTILCNNCGWQSLCKYCNIPHVFHHDLNTYLCHECGRKSPKITKCTTCNSEQIFYKTGGTKLVEKELSVLFPFANIARFDKDNNVTDHISNRYSDITEGKIDILVGTQILIKGHDFPKLGLVAMLQADSYLQYPDYTSREKLFQAVNQLYGRIDRGHDSGKFLIQTYSPKSEVIDQAIGNKWAQFYNSELEVRKKYEYPPFVFVLKIKHAMKNQAHIITFFEKLITSTLEQYNLVIDGPTPSLHHKKDDKWHYQIIVKSKNRSALLSIARSLPGNCRYEIDPSHLL